MRANWFLLVEVMILSSEDENVSWKLNDLIHASRRAAYRRYESLEHSEKEQEFLPWTPTMLKLIDDQFVELESEDQEAEDNSSLPHIDEDSEPEIEEKLIPETQLISERKDSYQRGLDEGKALIESELADKFIELDKLINGFTEIQRNLKDFHSPLVKLSLAIANHLVRAELKIDGKAVEELVSKSLSVIDNSGEDTVVVYLNSGDLEIAEKLLLDKYSNVKFEVDAQLSSGSLRVVMNETSIEDLIEHRLDSLASQLLDFPKKESSNSHEFSELSENIDKEELITQAENPPLAEISDGSVQQDSIEEEGRSEESLVSSNPDAVDYEKSNEEISLSKEEAQFASEEKVNLADKDNSP